MPPWSHGIMDDFTSCVVPDDGQSAALASAYAQSCVPVLGTRVIFVVVPVAFFAVAGRNFCASFLVR